MKKWLFSLIILIIGAFVGLRYLDPALSSFVDASGNNSSNIADMNQPLPRTVLPAVDQGWVDMESFKGKVVLVSFWTTWCSGCRDEMPDLIKLQQKFESKGFTVVAVSVDDQGEESVKTFVQTEHFSIDGSLTAMNFPVLLGDQESARKLGFEGGLPASILVARDAHEVKIIRGPFPWEEISKAIKQLL